MIKLLRIFLFVALTFFVVESSYAQRRTKGENYHENQNPFGKKHREKRNQSRALSKRGRGSLFKRKSSAGGADAFAAHRTTGKRGFLSKLFGGGNSNAKNASLRKTKPGKLHNKEQVHLFKHHKTPGAKVRNGKFLRRQNKQRGRSRRSSGFSGKKRR